MFQKLELQPTTLGISNHPNTFGVWIYTSTPSLPSPLMQIIISYAKRKSLKNELYIQKHGPTPLDKAKKTTTINNTKVKEFLEKKLPRD